LHPPDPHAALEEQKEMMRKLTNQEYKMPMYEHYTGVPRNPFFHVMYGGS
jgi:hypothetical protein